VETKKSSEFARKLQLVLANVRSFFSPLFYKSQKNEVVYLKGLRSGSYLCLNDVIRHRESVHSGPDPEPLIEY